MKLSQAVDYHSDVLLDGRNPDGTWTDYEVAKGSFLTFDKFITERSFGQKKRLFQCHSGGPIPDAFPIIRCQADEKPYLVVAANADIGGIQNPAKYNNIYLLQEAPYTVEVLSEKVTPKASGSGGTAEDVVDATVLGDYERLSSANSREFDSVTYSVMIFTLPGNVTLTTDKRLRVSGVEYDVKETWSEMQILKAKAVKRSGAA